MPQLGQKVKLIVGGMKRKLRSVYLNASGQGNSTNEAVLSLGYGRTVALAGGSDVTQAV